MLSDRTGFPRTRPTTPAMRAPPVWAPPRSLAATWGISFDFFSCRYLDGSLPCVYRTSTILFMDRATVIQTVGLPHSEIPGSWVVGTYPGLFAADHVLLRLAAPRHPPWTLFRLTILLFQFLTLMISKTAVLCLEAWGFEPQTLGLQSRCSSQLSYAPGSRLDGQRKKERSLEALSDNVLSCCARSL